eukprot:SAG31_NODE_12489_length_937_cov_22.682578_2_plen_93_part_00
MLSYQWMVTKFSIAISLLLNLVQVVLNLVQVLAREKHHSTQQVVDKEGKLPMHFAAWKNASVDVVRVLLEAGGAKQLQARDEHGRLPMHFVG